MNQLAALSISDIVPIILRARATLAQAETAAEVLDAREQSSLAYDAVKRATRLAKAKGAADDAIAAAHRLQADALDIRAAAERRIADEYDAAQERGEVAGVGKRFIVPEQNDKPTAADLGLSRRDIFEARQIRDAEADDPGFVRRVLDETLERGDEPTRAALVREIEARKPHVANNSGNNEWYTPPEFLEAARAVLGGFDLDPASSEIANRAVKAARIFTAEDDGLAQEWPIGRIFMNPPYAQPLMSQFADRFAAEVRRGSTGIVLVNNATETAWFQTLADECSAICFPKGRIKYLDPTGAPSGAPLQGQALLYFGNDTGGFGEIFAPLGLVVTHA